MNALAELLTNAAHEIRDLRRRNEVLAAKVEMIDLFALVFRTRPDYPTVGMSPDVAWALDKKAAEIHEETKPRPPAAWSPKPDLAKEEPAVHKKEST